MQKFTFTQQFGHHIWLLFFGSFPRATFIKRALSQASLHLLLPIRFR